MTTYIVRTLTGENIEIMAESAAQAARKLLEQRPGTMIEEITPAASQRAADQQA